MLQWGSASLMAGLRKTVESAAKPSVIRILLNQTVNKSQLTGDHDIFGYNFSDFVSKLTRIPYDRYDR